MRCLFFTLFLFSASWALECYTGTFSSNGYTLIQFETRWYIVKKRWLCTVKFTGSNEDSGPYGHPSNVLPSLNKCSKAAKCCVHTSWVRIRISFKFISMIPNDVAFFMSISWHTWNYGFSAPVVANGSDASIAVPTSKANRKLLLRWFLSYFF